MPRCKIFACEGAAFLQCDACKKHVCLSCASRCLSANLVRNLYFAEILSHCAFCRNERSSHFDLRGELTFVDEQLAIIMRDKSRLHIQSIAVCDRGRWDEAGLVHLEGEYRVDDPAERIVLAADERGLLLEYSGANCGITIFCKHEDETNPGI